jgi:predicted transcriptional regulator
LNKPTKNIITEVQDIMPTRAVMLGEALILAEHQATVLLKRLGITHVPVDVFRLSTLPRIKVEVKPRHEMPVIAGLSETAEVAGVTRRFKGGTWLLTINREDGPGWRRFSLAHEFKHVLDFLALDVVYGTLGYGDEERRQTQIEQVCDHFAACFLMPRIVLRRAWACGIQDLEALAGQFNVPLDAMHDRLCYLGLTTEPDRPVAEYFRRTAPDLVTVPIMPYVAA